MWQLIKEIESFFSKEIKAEKSVLDYINSTFSYPNIDGIKDAIKNEDASLLDLLFFPTIDMQVQIEPLLEKIRLTKFNENEIYEILKSKNLWQSIKFFENSAYIKVYIPDYILKNFISRLKIYKHLPYKIVEKINDFFEHKKSTLIKVKLRNAKKIDEEKSKILILFFEKFFVEEGFFKYFDFLISFLPDVKTDISFFLKTKRDRAIMALKNSKEIQEKLKLNNFETLRMQGITILSVDEKRVTEEIELINFLLMKQSDCGTV